MKKLIIAAALAAALLLTVFATYRVTMKAARVDVAGDVAYITVFGRTDVYSVRGEDNG